MDGDPGDVVALTYQADALFYDLRLTVYDAGMTQVGQTYDDFWMIDLGANDHFFFRIDAPNGGVFDYDFDTWRVARGRIAGAQRLDRAGDVPGLGRLRRDRER